MPFYIKTPIVDETAEDRCRDGEDVFFHGPDGEVLIRMAEPVDGKTSFLVRNRTPHRSLLGERCWSWEDAVESARRITGEVV